MRSPPLLALWTEKRAPLGLHNAADDPLITAAAQLSRAVIDAVQILVSAVFVQRIAVGSIGEGRALMLNRFKQDCRDRCMNPCPLRPG